jgi:23S rRNA pseudouridine2604 synthase
LSEVVRLSKLMSQRGMCSRREADKMIEQGLVRVDGEIVNTLGIKFSDSVDIQLTQRAAAMQSELVTIMINKPVGYVSAQAEDGYVPAVRLVNKENHSETDQTGQPIRGSHFAGLAPAGRLDIDSQGLLVLTQDGRIAKQLIGENSDIEKEYLVRVEGDISDDQIERLTFGLELDGKPLKHAKVRQLNPEQLQIILMEGKKRQIRRMCEAVGLRVTGLKRVRVGELRLGKLEEGKWRFVKAEEFRHRSSKQTSSTKTVSEAKYSSSEKETSPKQASIPSDGKSLYGRGKARPKRRG